MKFIRKKQTFHPLVELEDSIQDLICLLHHTPALVHVDQPSIRKENGWPSKLPREARGHNDQAYFTNLQTDGKKDDFIKLLSKKAYPRGKRGKQQSYERGYQRTCWAPEVSQSKLALNSEGTRKYADFSNLQTGDKKSEAIKLLSSEDSSKRLKT